MSKLGDEQREPMHPVPLVGVMLIGALFLGVGVHERNTHIWTNRPSRPWFQIATGLGLIAFSIIGLFRYWQSRRP